MKAVFDTNILIDYLLGIQKAADEIARIEKPCISLITWIEVMLGAQSEEEEKELRGFLGRFRCLNPDRSVAERAGRLRKSHKLRLPDALVWAAAEEEGCILITRNKSDFPAGHPGIRVPYQP